MSERQPAEGVIEFSPVLKGSDAGARRFGSRRFSPYRAALFLQDFVVVCVAAWAGLWASGLLPLATGQPVQVGFTLVLALMVLGFYPTFHLYKYRYVFMPKVHLWNLLRALFWGFLAVGIVVAVYRYPDVLDATGALVLVGVAGLGFLLLSRYYLGELLHVLKALGFAFVALGIFGLVSREERPLIADDGAVFWWTVLLTVSAVLASRFFTVHLVFSNWLRRRFRRQVAIIGSDEEAKRITEHIVAKQAPFWVAGFIGHLEGGNADLPRAKPVLGELRDLPSVAHRERLDDIIVTDEGMDKRVLISLLDYCTSAGLSVWFSPKLLPIINVKVYIDSFCGIPMIRLCSQRHDWVFNKVKHGLDALITVPACVVLLPFWLLVGLAIKLNSPGPVFYRAAAIGKDGRPFRMYKFRSMRVDADNGMHKEFVTKLIKGEIRREEGEQGKVLKITDDPRVTWVGRILRRSSLDELPQLFDVVRGEMSLVGPRPCLPYEYEIYEDWHKKRLSIRPGITGLWQVAGRSEVEFEDMVLLDLYYIYNRSLSMDMSILYETVFAVLGRKGAH